jgi:hypothetical protein
MTPSRNESCEFCYRWYRDVRLALSAARSFLQSSRVLLTALTHGSDAFHRAAVFRHKERTVRGYAGLANDGTGAFDEQNFVLALERVTRAAQLPGEFDAAVRQITVAYDATEHPLIYCYRTALPMLLPGGLNELQGAGPFGPGFVFPLFSRGGVCGVVYAERPTGSDAVTEEDMWRTASLGNMLGFQSDAEPVRPHAISEPVPLIAERLLTVTRLAMRLAHLARNPLAVVGGFSHHLITRFDESKPERRALEAILRNTERLEDLIDCIPAYALSPDTEPVETDLRDVIEEAIAALPTDRVWRFDAPKCAGPVTTYADLLTACVYMAASHLAHQGFISLRENEEGGYGIVFQSDHFLSQNGLESATTTEIVHMIGGQCRWEADAEGRRFCMSVPEFVHCPITKAETVERF